MKANRFFATSAALVTGYAFLISAARSQTVPPDGLTGTIAAVQTTVLTGQKPTLNWTVNYPSVVAKVVTIDTDKITPKIDLFADVRIIGQGVTTSNDDGTFNFVPTYATMSINESTFKPIFFGVNPNVNPGNIIQLGNVFGTTYTNNLVQAGKALKFGGYWKEGRKSYGTHYKSSDGSNNVRFLVNGQTPPTNVPDYNAPSLESFLRPYLDTTGKVKIGPMDVIVFMELTHTPAQHADVGFDLQDMVLLVTFRNP